MITCGDSSRKWNLIYPRTKRSRTLGLPVLSAKDGRLHFRFSIQSFAILDFVQVRHETELTFLFYIQRGLLRRTCDYILHSVVNYWRQYNLDQLLRSALTNPRLMTSDMVGKMFAFLLRTISLLVAFQSLLTFAEPDATQPYEGGPPQSDTAYVNMVYFVNWYAISVPSKPFHGRTASRGYCWTMKTKMTY